MTTHKERVDVKAARMATAAEHASKIPPFQ